jgi:hypothetical protein
MHHQREEADQGMGADGLGQSLVDRRDLDTALEIGGPIPSLIALAS